MDMIDVQYPSRYPANVAQQTRRRRLAQRAPGEIDERRMLPQTRVGQPIGRLVSGNSSTRAYFRPAELGQDFFHKLSGSGAGARRTRNSGATSLPRSSAGIWKKIAMGAC